MNAEIRRTNFETLVRQRFGDSNGKAAQALGLSPGRITQLLDPKEAFGERVARKIEDRLDLPSGWLDGPRPTVAVAPAAAVPTPDAGSPATLRALAETLAQVLLTMDDQTRDRAQQLLANLAQAPDSAIARTRLADLMEQASTSTAAPAATQTKQPAQRRA